MYLVCRGTGGHYVPGFLGFAKADSLFQACYITTENRMVRKVLYFLETAKIFIYQANMILILAFMEYLHQKGASHSKISNHVAAVRAVFMVYGLDTTPFADERLPLFIKALKINAPLKPKKITIIATANYTDM